MITSGPTRDDLARRQIAQRVERITDEVRDELLRALVKFPSFNSGHEGKAVIEEELDELWEAIKQNEPSSAFAKNEAIQVAAMACRYVLDLCSPFAGGVVGDTERDKP